MSALGDRCVRRWRSILGMFGVDEKFLTGRHGPCPACGGTDRFRFDDKDGRGSWICSSCGAGDGFKLLMALRGWTFAEAASEVEKIVGKAEVAEQRKRRSEAECKDAMRSLWRASVPLSAGDPVSKYLASRGLAYAPGGPIRFAPSAYCGQEGPRFRPAMVAAVLRPDGKVANIHRTYLTDDGRKAPVDRVRLVMEGELPDGIAVRLAPATDVLGIAEGIETALSAAKLFGVPCWAALNAGRLAVWRPPRGVRRVVIFGDHDANYAGQQAAYTLARKLSAAEIEVEIRFPPNAGDDWNDVLMASATETQGAR